ncbi:MAG TPA: DNA repair protein RecO [Candidatus Acidoferrales bacterium]|nr:DNA repair protein RecO [Candidatus Acidoferrales bacterium]
MPVRESEAIVLRTYPLGEADKLVSFLSRSEGRLRGVAVGARRPKSRFGSTLEPLTYINAWFYERETRQLVRIRECELLESFLDAQRSYTTNVAFGLLAEVTETVLPEHEASDPAFRLLLATCRAIKRTGRVALPIAYFALWTVRLGGWLPPLERCSRCGRGMLGRAAWASDDGSAVFCDECRPTAARAISPEALRQIQPMLREPLEKLAAAGESRVPAELTNFLLDLIERHAERKLNTRPMLELTQ